jgi:hypothetical protein
MYDLLPFSAGDGELWKLAGLQETLNRSAGRMK